MKRAWLRSTLFNIAFIGATGVMCIFYIPLLLLPRKVFTGAVRFWIYVVTALEYGILGLSYEVRGREFLPADGPYIIAAKHQSPYETIKLRLLFPDPAIILKKELLSIPMWGWYLKKSGVIAIDRGTPERALKSIEDGAIKMAADGRPIVIFVQGTRVRPDETPKDKPYKPGVARIQDVTQLPVIPMALNTGLFWPRSGWLKSPGKAVFEFFEPVPPGKNRKDLLKELEEKLESESSRLMNESRADELNEKTSGAKTALVYAVLFGLAFAGYSALWSQTAKLVREMYIAFLKDIAETERLHAEPVIGGFPGPIKMTVAEDSVRSPEGSVRIENLVMTGWPVPFVPVHIKTGTITVRSYKWSEALVLDSFDAWATYFNNTIDIKDSALLWRDFEARAEGKIDLRQEPVPEFDMTVTLKNYAPFLGHLAELRILEEREALFMAAGFGLLAQDGIVKVPITQNGQTLYAGPLPVVSLPADPRPAQHNSPDQYQ